MNLRLHLAPWSGAAAAALLIASGAGTAHADELSCALYGVGCPRAAQELGEPADGDADLGVGLTVRHSETRTDVGAGVFVGVPLWRWLGDVPGPARAALPDPTRDADDASAEDDGAKETTRDEAPADAAARDEPDRKGRVASHRPEVRSRKAKAGGRTALAAPLAPSHVPPPIGPDDARAAVAAAARARGADDVAERLDDLASRARWSAALPEVRLRATRLVDESTSLSPTSYDAARTMASGGTSLWLEARLAWRLDRALFADEEVRLERLRQEEAERTTRRGDEVLRLLFAWQRASLALSDDAATAELCWNAWLEEQELAAALEVVTGGWFGPWRREREPVAEPTCAGRPLAPPEERP